MNNNSNSNRGNNRRRGRGNRQQGGGNQNRIDSRARGNAPQMLDKYKKLAQDAAHNGDRVQAEYYLQFADHYFRVIADSRPRGDDQQQQRGRRDEQDFSNDDDGDEDDFAAPRQSREDRPRDDRQRDDRQRDDRPREDRQDRQRDDRPRGDRNRNDRQRQPRGDAESESGNENGGTEYEPADNPFVRPSRNRARGERGNRARSDETAEMTGNEGEIDASALPPSFSAANESAPEAEPERATRKLPPRRRRKPEGDAGEADDNLTAVG